MGQENGSSKPVVSRTAAILASIVAAIAAGVVMSVLNQTLTRPSADLNMLRDHIDRDQLTVRERVASLDRGLSTAQNAIENEIPARFARVFEQIHQSRGNIDILRKQFEDFALREMRPDPFTGKMGGAMEARITHDRGRDFQVFNIRLKTLRSELSRVLRMVKELEVRGRYPPLSPNYQFPPSHDAPKRDFDDNTKWLGEDVPPMSESKRWYTGISEPPLPDDYDASYGDTFLPAYTMTASFDGPYDD